MMYLWNNGEVIELPIGKAVCVGRNYVAHAAELGNEVPTEPLLFLKPASSIVNAEGEVALDHSLGEHHYEAELMLLIGKPLNKDNIADYKSCIAGLGVGLDLTLRDEQAKLKAKGHPWVAGVSHLAWFIGVGQGPKANRNGYQPAGRAPRLPLHFVGALLL